MLAVLGVDKCCSLYSTCSVIWHELWIEMHKSDKVPSHNTNQNAAARLAAKQAMF